MVTLISACFVIAGLISGVRFIGLIVKLIGRLFDYVEDSFLK